MRSLLIILVLAIQPTQSGLINSSWMYKVTNTCINTLKFKAGGKVYNYNCELDYTFRDTYKISADTVTIFEKDDSHSEDGGKPDFYQEKYVIRGNALYGIGYSKLIHGKWKTTKVKPRTEAAYTRVK
ncbi:hypothetical protein ACFFGT_18925 [Mucilaginibacter angelicae]|uniref:Uncharacterized protein n=1 Tax=Mucilaginibacter angelicae TaxID=869718 RepID=A0ABV6L9Z6_9SPHI